MKPSKLINKAMKTLMLVIEKKIETCRENDCCDFQP